MNIVTIMNYSPKQVQYHKMCRIWLDRVIRHGGDNILILYDNHEPNYIRPIPNTNAHIVIRKGKRDHRIGRNHFNAYFKLPNLASLKRQFIFLDCDMYVIADLRHLWELRNSKPFIGINHQRIPKHSDTHRKPFLNSGLQIVSDPAFYDFEKILKSHIANKRGYRYPGVDQSILNVYFKSIGYDYTHPDVGAEWNSCAAVGKLWQENGVWKGKTNGLKQDHAVYINHYWCDYKPWEINCPLHKSYDN